MRPRLRFIWLSLPVLVASAFAGAGTSHAQYALPDDQTQQMPLGPTPDDSRPPPLPDLPLPSGEAPVLGPEDIPAGSPDDRANRDQVAPPPANPKLAAPEPAEPNSEAPNSPAPPVGPKTAEPDGTPAPGDSGRPPSSANKDNEPQDRDAVLAELYMHLAQAKDAQEAEPIAKAIEGLWAHSDSPTIGLLMARASKAVNDQHPELALKLLDAVVELSPDFAEGWNRRAYVYYMQNDVEHAAGDLRRALALDPKNYKALEGLARILRDGGQKKSALGAYQQLLQIYPFSPGAKDAAKALSLEVEGQGI